MRVKSHGIESSQASHSAGFIFLWGGTSLADKLSIFIDGGYLFRAFKEEYSLDGYRYSPKRLIRRISEESVLVKVHYFDSINNRDAATKQKQERFFYGLLRDKLGWDVEILPLQWPDGVNAEQKGVDTSIALKLHALAIEGEYEVAVLLAADSDFVPAVDRVKKTGRVVRNAYYSKCPSWHLQQACNGKHIRLDEIDFIYKQGDPMNLLRIDDIKTP
jgi:uncharacterized LabA/DUF88 family protein